MWGCDRLHRHLLRKYLLLSVHQHNLACLDYVLDVEVEVTPNNSAYTPKIPFWAETFSLIIVDQELVSSPL